MLNIKPDCTPGSMKIAYKKAILKQHPDKGGSSDEYLKTQLAYKTLQNSHTRKIYDEYGPKGAEFYNIIMDF